jgi:predicted HD phosphohydrolase
MNVGTRAQWARIAAADTEFARGLPDRLFSHMLALRDERHGFAIDRLEHCLQAATRAHRDGRDDEYVTCALFHDIGAALAPADHAQFGAMILRPYIGEANHWMLSHHGIFQSYYFAHLMDADRDEREQHRSHPHFQRTAEFCHLYDQAAFDPNYVSMSLQAFRPIVERVLARPRQGGVYAGARSGSG